TSGGAIPSPSRMMLPLPNCFSMVVTARSMALSRATSRSRTGALATSLASLASFASLLSLTSFMSRVSLVSGVAMVVSLVAEGCPESQEVRRAFAAEAALVQVNLAHGRRAELAATERLERGARVDAAPLLRAPH